MSQMCDQPTYLHWTVTGDSGTLFSAPIDGGGDSLTSGGPSMELPSHLYNNVSYACFVMALYVVDVASFAMLAPRMVTGPFMSLGF